MNPYNQQTVNMPDLQNAMLQHQDQQRKLAAANQLAQGGNGWGGIGEILGAALGAYKSNKLAGEADQTGMQINDQLSQLQAQQEAEIQRIAQEKAEREYQRKMADEKAKYEREQAGRMQIAKYKADNAKPGVVVKNTPGVQLGSIDKGYMLKQDEQGNYYQAPIPGSPAEREANAAKSQAINSTQTTLQSNQNIQEIGEQVMDQVGPLSSGFIGSLTKNIGQTPAKDLQANLGTLQADSAFSTLVELKKNGGTLGAISKDELDLLKSAQAALDQDQSPGQLRQNIKRYLDIRQNLMTRAAEAYKTDFGVYPEGFGMENSAPQGGLSDDELYNKY